MSFRIGSLTVGGGGCFIIGEVGLAHDGSLILAHAYIDAIADAGADAVKFQCHNGDQTDKWRVVPGYSQDTTREQYWKRTAFRVSDWAGLKQHAEDRGLVFLCSPFSVEAADLLRSIGVRAWKIPSGQIANMDLLDAVAETGKPVIFSTGMSDWREVDNAVCRHPWNGLAVLECVSLYPTPAEHVHLARMRELRRRYGCAVGLSDHSGKLAPGICAAYDNADILEVHLCFDRREGGLDAASSLTVDEFAVLVSNVRFAGEMGSGDVPKVDATAAMRKVFLRAS